MIRVGTPGGRRASPSSSLLVAMSIMLVLAHDDHRHLGGADQRLLVLQPQRQAARPRSPGDRPHGTRDPRRAATARLHEPGLHLRLPERGALLLHVQHLGCVHADDRVRRLTRFIYRVTDAAEGTGAVYREFPGADGDFDTATTTCPQLLVGDVSNASAGKDVFTYWSYDPLTADLVPSDGMTTLVDPSRIVEVGITLLVDLNPGKAPNYMDLSTTVQPRNVREF